jgi:hypothetical protein
VSAKGWQGDIRTSEKWATSLRIDVPKKLLFRFKTRLKLESPVTYEVYCRPARKKLSSKRPRPVETGTVNPPARRGTTRTFEVDFTKHLPKKPDGRNYQVRIKGTVAGNSNETHSNTVTIAYKTGPVTQFDTPTIEKVTGTKDAKGREIRASGRPVAVVNQVFTISGTAIDDFPGETRIQFLRTKRGKVVKQVKPVRKLSRKESSGRVHLAVHTPPNLRHGNHYVQVAASMGTTLPVPVYIGGNGGAYPNTWRVRKGGVYENHTWTEECQGITTDGKHWYISSNNDGDRAIYKFTIGMKQVARHNMQPYGSAHVGDLDYYDGHLYIALEQPKQLLVMSTDFKRRRMFQLSGRKVGSADPLGGTLAWCAVHPITKEVCTTSFGYADALYCYARARGDNYALSSTRYLKPATKRVQGGVITPNGKLLLASDAKPFGINVYSSLTGKYYGRRTFSIDDSATSAEEVEGLTVSPRHGVMVGGNRANVHLVILDNDKPDNDDVFFKHFSLRTKKELYDF